MLKKLQMESLENTSLRKVTPLTLDGIELQLYTDEEVRKLGVVQILNPSTYDRGLPKANGVNDPRMGVTDKHLQCPTCGLTSTCNNHYGYIELEKPVLRLGHMASILCLLRSFCWACSRPKFFSGVNQNEAFTDGFVDIRSILSKSTAGTKERLRAVSEMCKNKFKCPWTNNCENPCGVPQPVYSRKNKLFIDRNFRAKEKSMFSCAEEFAYVNRRMFPDEIRKILTFIPQKDLETLGYKPNISHPKNYVFQVQLVPPPSIRPANVASSTEARMRCENDLTVSIQDVVRANNDLGNVLRTFGSDKQSKVEEAWDRLQIFIASIINQNAKKLSTFSGSPAVHARAMGKNKKKDIKSRLTGKRGRLRGNLSGKRVDHAGRTVVGPDAMHDIFQLGVPSAIMKILTFPEHVNQFNIKDLAHRILKGANVSGGALTVQRSSEENVIYTSLLDYESRLALAESLKVGWTVERHLKNDDWVLFNRQPSLHKASIMAFRAYEVSGLQFKLPLPCTKPFNADFDGDEMNIHALQNYPALAEAQELMAVPHQMVTPQNNSVIISLVQDSLVGAFLMSRKDAYVGIERSMQLLMSIHYSTKNEMEYSEMPTKQKISYFDTMEHFPYPAILKGIDKNGKVTRPCWTGKQLLSCLLPKSFNLVKSINQSSADSIEDTWNDNVVTIKNGEILCGVLCKQTVGNSSGGIVQTLWKTHGPWAAAKFVSDAQRILMDWLRIDTVCISISDCLTPCESKIDKITSEAMGKSDALNFTDIPSAIRELKQTQILQETLRVVGATVLENMDKRKSGIATVIDSGAKGNLMNIAQIAGLVGQQTINGTRIPFRQGPKGRRTLANFSPNDNSPEARGFVASSYIMGLQPSEFFFHQQAGREGVVATAVSTADTGYNQRRMVKNQESEVIAYDYSVRVSSNLIVEFHYGGDDYDGSMVERIKIPALEASSKMEAMNILLDSHTGKEEKRLLEKSFQILKDLKETYTNFGAEKHSYVSIPANFLRILKSYMSGKMTFETPMKHQEKDFIRNTMLINILGGILDSHGSMKHVPNKATCSLETLLFWESRNVFCEDDPSLYARLCIFMQCTSKNLREYSNYITQDDADAICEAFLRTYQKGIVNPGEGVGAVGSSSIGEPSTQMTLNIFHYSGIAEKNVTITGLPRFKQIINAIDTYDTSNMIIFQQANAGAKKEISSKECSYTREFATNIAKTKLSQITKSSRVIDLHYYKKNKETKELNDNEKQEAFLMDMLELTSEMVLMNKVQSGQQVPKKQNHKGLLKDVLNSSESSCKHSSFAAIFVLDKGLLINKHIDLQQVYRALSDFLGSDAALIVSNVWEEEWKIIVLPPLCGGMKKEEWKENEQRMLTESFHDAFLEYATINGIDVIKKAVPLYVEAKKEWCVETEGSNFIDVIKLPNVDPLKTATNNIQEVATFLGVEAGLCLMQNELHKVLSFDGSYVDPRHTWLLTNTVARSGSINPLNRHKMEEMGGSLLQCASFEQTLDVFEHGAAFAKNDTLCGATEKLIVGQPVNVGTGSFAIIEEENKSIRDNGCEERGALFVSPLEFDKNEFDKMDTEFSNSIRVAPMREKEELVKQPKNVKRMNFYLPCKELPEKNTVLSLQTFSEKLCPLIFVMRQQSQSQKPVWISCSLHHRKRAHGNIHATEFENIEKCLETYKGWASLTSQRQFTQYVDVFYDIGEGNEMSTRIDHSKSLISTTHRKSCTLLTIDECDVNENWSIKGTAVNYVSCDNDELPQYVRPKSVKIIQQKQFLKGSWLIELSKVWAAENIVDAEALQKFGSKTCIFNVRIEIQKPWNLLELRGSSDKALACGILERAASLLDVIH